VARFEARPSTPTDLARQGRSTPRRRVEDIALGERPAVEHRHRAPRNPGLTMRKLDLAPLVVNRRIAENRQALAPVSFEDDRMPRRRRARSARRDGLGGSVRSANAIVAAGGDELAGSAISATRTWSTANPGSCLLDDL
jgi:hypothetical protein